MLSGLSGLSGLSAVAGGTTGSGLIGDGNSNSRRSALTYRAGGLMLYGPIADNDLTTQADRQHIIRRSYRDALIVGTPTAVANSYSINEDVELVVAAPGVLTNDTDPTNLTLTADLVTNVGYGLLVLNPNGSFSYTPDADYFGNDSFQYRAYNGTFYSNTVTVTITINPIDDPAVANDDSYSTNEDTTLNVSAPGYLSNDTDIENDSLVGELVSGVSNGVLTFNTDGSFSYTPDSNFNGTDSFTYRVYDGSYYSNVATVTITVNAVSDAPVASNDSYSVNEDTLLTVSAPGVLSNDTDLENDTLTAILVSDVSNGTLTLNSDGSFTYMPDADFNGSDSFTYKANDGTSDSNTATVVITVNAVNDAPVTVADSYTVAQGQVLTVSAPGVLSNDTDVENNSLTAILVSDVSNGTLTLNSNGSFVYTPTPSYFGSDSFTYKSNDGTSDGNTVTVSITVEEVGFDSLTLTATRMSEALVVADWNDVTDPEEYEVQVNIDSAGWETVGSSLTNSFFDHYINPPTSVSLNAANSLGFMTSGLRFAPPVADGTIAITDAGHAVRRGTRMLTGGTFGTSDIRASAMTYRAGGLMLYGMTADGSLTSQADRQHMMRRSYRDAIITQVAQAAPVANNDAYTANEDELLVIPAPGVLGNDTDINLDPLTAELVTDVSDGTLVLNADGSFIYQGDANFSGSDSFVYRVYDGVAYSGNATVTLTVNAVSDAPVAVSDSYSMAGDTTLVVDAPGVLSNDTDAENDSLTAILVTDVTEGTLSLSSDGSFTYTPGGGYVGSDSFTYMVNDGTSNSNTVTVTITIGESTNIAASALTFATSGLRFIPPRADGDITTQSDRQHIVRRSYRDKLVQIYTPEYVALFEDWDPTKLSYNGKTWTRVGGIRQHNNTAREFNEIQSGGMTGMVNQTLDVFNEQMRIQMGDTDPNDGDGGAFYFQFYTKDPSYIIGNGFLQNWILSGPWNSNVNTIRWRYMLDATVTNYAVNGHNTLGNYVKNHSNTDGGFQGSHWYNRFGNNWYANKWVICEMSAQPQTQVGTSGNSVWPYEPELVENGGGQDVNYWDGMTRFYLSLWPSFVRSDLVGTTMLFDDFWFLYKSSVPLIARTGVANGPLGTVYVAAVSNVTVTHNGTAYELTWCGPKHTPTITYDIYRSSVSMIENGLSAGTLLATGGATTPGSAYTGCIYTTTTLPDEDCYFAIKPQGYDDFYEIFYPNYNS